MTINDEYFDFHKLDSKFDEEKQKQKMDAWIEGKRNFNIKCATKDKLAYNHWVLTTHCWAKYGPEKVNPFISMIEGELYMRKYNQEFNT